MCSRSAFHLVSVRRRPLRFRICVRSFSNTNEIHAPYSEFITLPSNQLREPISDIKLSELSIGIGPFVIAPALERKMGVSAFSALSLEAKSWKIAYWAEKKGLFNTVFENTRDLDNEIDILTQQLSQYNPEALFTMKKIFWEGTDHWDTLLIERAEISGKLVLSDFTKEALSKFKNK